MIGYVTVATNDPDKANAYFGALLAEIGASRLMSDDGYTFYGKGWDQPLLTICRPYDGQPHSVGNGAMVALQMPDRATVDRFHARAIALGGSDEGAPGPRGPAEMNFYGAYFRDPDGNKFAAFTIGQA